MKNLNVNAHQQQRVVASHQALRKQQPPPNRFGFVVVTWCRAVDHRYKFWLSIIIRASDWSAQCERQHINTNKSAPTNMLFSSAWLSVSKQDVFGCFRTASFYPLTECNNIWDRNIAYVSKYLTYTC